MDLQKLHASLDPGLKLQCSLLASTLHAHYFVALRTFCTTVDASILSWHSVSALRCRDRIVQAFYGLTLDKLQPNLSSQFLAQKNVLYNVLKVLGNSMGEIEQYVAKLLPYMAVIRGCGLIISLHYVKDIKF